MGTVRNGSRHATVYTDEERKRRLAVLLESMSPETREVFFGIADGDYESLQQLTLAYNETYHTIPVPPEEFFTSPYYIGENDSVYPVIRQTIEDIFNGNYSEIICTGGIGVGKSFLAVNCFFYCIYLLWCMRDPARTFGLSGKEAIYLVMIGTSVRQVKRTLYRKFVARCLTSPWFLENIRTDMPSTVDEVELTDQIRLYLLPSHSNAAIGMDVYGAIQDEVNFGENSRAKATDDMNADTAYASVAETNFKSLKNRIASRFKLAGKSVGKLFVISSSNNDEDLTAKRIQAALSDPSIYVYDKSIWEVKPEYMTGNHKFFRVFYGGRTMRSRILEDGEPDPVFNEESGAQILHIPEVMRIDFERDLPGAIRDIAGVSLPNQMHFIQRREMIGWLSEAWPDRRHPFHGDHWVSGAPETFVWEMMCQMERRDTGYGFTEDIWRPLYNPDCPRHIHIDLSKGAADSTGFAMGHVSRMVEVPFLDVNTGQHRTELRPMIEMDVVLEIRAPQMGEIEGDHIKMLIYQLMQHGFMISSITLDSWQSLHLQQHLNTNVAKTEILSVDKKPTPYLMLKEAMSQRRVFCYYYPILEVELEHLQRDFRRQKIDHPPNYSKDVSDALAGVVYSLHQGHMHMPDYIGATRAKPAGDRTMHPSHPLMQFRDPQGRVVKTTGSSDDLPLPFIMG